VHLDLSDDQRDLQEGIRKLCRDRFPPEVVRSFGEEFDRDRWQELAAMGVFTLAQPEDEGGVGLSLVESALTYEVLGEHLVPGPVVGNHLARAADDVIIAEDEIAVVVAVSEAPSVVADLDVADMVITLRPDSVSIVDPAQIGWRPLEEALDPTSRVGEITSLPQGDRVGGADTAHSLRMQGSLLTSAMLVGVAETACRSGTAYASQRMQFDRPIGSFQAVQQLLADTYAKTEVARAALYAAAATLASGGAPGDREVAVARIVATSAAIDNARTCIQVHGGMGFTWEVDAHLFLKRAFALAVDFGSLDEAAETMAAQL
jgi:alkylation response protein AidB-like acyl-CoA dehydrogenase